MDGVNGSKMDDIFTVRLKNGCILTKKSVLCREPSSKFSELVSSSFDNQIFIFDRDSNLIKLIINALRDPDIRLILSDDFSDWQILLAEAQFWKLTSLESYIREKMPVPATISISYHGTLTFGRQGAASDLNFRKIQRIIVCGKVSICRQVFGDSLNEARDGGMDEDRYTNRFYLKHSFLEQAFDALVQNGFHMVSSSSHTPANIISMKSKQSDEERYMHYSQFIFQNF